MSVSRSKWISIGGLIVTGALIGMVLSAQLGWKPSDKEQAHQYGYSQASYEPVNTEFDPAVTSKAFTNVSKVILPTVVSISTSKMVKGSGDDFFNPFFREFFGETPKQEQRLQGLGSGVIVSRNGYILTNHHVIQDAEDMKVTLYDKRSFEAKLVGTDPLTEIAVIKIESDDLPAVRLGNSDDLEIGEWVLAVGNPLNLTSTVTAGIVSAVSRKIDIIGSDEEARNEGGSYAIENFIQTDAAINPGNSGGALVNLHAEVIGINTAIATRTGGYQGYGFAVPINLAKKVMEDLVEKGYVTRAYLGIGMMPITEAIAQRYSLDKPTGVLIDQIMDDSPAQKAGLKPLDILLKVDNKVMEAPNEVQNYIALKDPGETIVLTILRDGKKKDLQVTLGQKDMGKETANKAESEEDLPKLGINVNDLTPELRSRYEMYKDEAGVIVSDVEDYSAGEEARISRGDLIYKIEDVPIQSVSDYKKAIKAFEKGKVVIFYIKRQSREIHAFVKLPK